MNAATSPLFPADEGTPNAAPPAALPGGDARAAGGGGSRSFLRDNVTVWASYAASRLLILGVILLSKLVIVRGRYWHPGDWLDILTQWDGGWYLHIARSGYFDRPEFHGSVVFFPFYPLLVRGAALVFHDYRVAALVVANGCLLAAGLLFKRLLDLEFRDPQVTRTGVVLLMFSPASFFFSSAYTESTFLMLAVAAFLAARQGRWWTAGLCAMALSATRNIGLWMFFALLLEHIARTRVEQGGRLSFRGLLRPRLLAVGLAPFGLIAYLSYCQWKAGDFLAFTHASGEWGRKLATPWQTLANVRFQDPFYQWLFLGALTMGWLLWVSGIVLRLRASYVVWSVLLMLTYLSSNSLEATPRYLSVVFPLFFAAALLLRRHRWLYEPYLAFNVVMLTLCTVLFACGYWMI